MSRLEQLENLLKDSPGDSFLLFALAKEFEGRQNDEKALGYYQQLASADPNYVGLYYHLGKLLERLGQFPEAFKTYTKGMEVARSQGDQHALNELAGARLELGDEEDFA